MQPCHIAAGTDILETTVYAQQPVASKLGKFAQIVRRRRTETNISHRPVTVALLDTSRQASQQKHVFLGYLVQNWTSHASSLTSASLSWERITEIIFRRKYLFDVKPWESECYKMNIIDTHSQLGLFRWAIDEGLPTFLEFINQKERLAQNEAKDGEHPLIRAAKANQLASFESCCKLGVEISDWFDFETVVALCGVASVQMLRTLSLYISSHVLALLSHGFLQVCRNGDIYLVKAYEALGVISRDRKELPSLSKALAEAVQNQLEIAEFLINCQPLATKSYEHLKALLITARNPAMDSLESDLNLFTDNPSFFKFLRRCWLSETDPLAHAFLMHSIHQRDYNIFAWLLDYGVDVNTRSAEENMHFCKP
jgi:hypothetical protein